MENVVKRKTVRWPKREHDRIFSRSSLEFEIELATKPFAQRESPGTIETTAKRRMQHQLHAAAVVKKPFEHQVLLRRHHPEHDLRSRQILDDLLRSRLRQPNLVNQPLDRQIHLR